MTNSRELLRRTFKKIGIEKKPQFDPMAPAGHKPRGTPAEYRARFEEAKSIAVPEIDAFLKRFDNHIDLEWLNDLALPTQITLKSSPANFVHGRLLYSILFHQLSNSISVGAFKILETGTAGGFSSIVMAKALLDSKKDGHIITLDLVPHHHEMYWNSIEDHVGKTSRASRLSRWENELSRVTFVCGDSREVLPKLGQSRVHFAFLDGAHFKDDVLMEFDYVSRRQRPGDSVFFDDVTPGQFDGIVEALKTIEQRSDYIIEYLQSSPLRRYAWAKRVA